MEQDNLINYLYRRLKNEHLWFVTKTNNNGSYWQTKPKKYFDLDEYGELKNKSKVEKEINEYLGDGAETISEAVSLYIADNVVDGSISQTDYLIMDYKDKPVEYSENAVEVKNIEPKYIEPQITGSNKQVESKQLNEIALKVPGTTLEKKQEISENLNTGVLPLINVDMYSIFSSGMLDDVDTGDTTEELDKLVEEIAPKYLEEIISEVLPSVKIIPTDVYHPKEYNFSGDELEFTLTVNSDEYNQLKDKILNDSQFSTYIKDKFSSRSGFISSMPDSLDEFNSSENWKQLVEVIMFATRDMNLEEVNDNYLDEFLEIVKEEFPIYEELDESKKQEDIFDDVTNGKAQYGVYDDKDERNLKDRYKEPIYAKRNKIRNFKDDKFTQRPIRDIINKGVTHVDYEKMPNERVQAYKNSKKQEDYFDKMNKLRKDAENKMINSLKKEFPEAKVSDVIESKYAGDRILLTNNGKRVTIYFMDEQGEDGKPWFMVIKNKANKESYSGNIEDVIKYIKTNILVENKKVENWKYKSLKDMAEANNKEIVAYNKVLDTDTGIENIFDFSNKNGGAIDSFRYYNNYVVVDKRNNKKLENVQRRLNEENNKSLNIISDMFKSKDFDSDSKAGQIVMRTSNMFNALSDKGYDVQVAFDNGESTNTILLGQQGGQIKITITDTNTPLRAFTDGSFELTEDNIKTLEDISKEIKTL